MIRVATIDDLEQVVKIGMRFMSHVKVHTASVEDFTDFTRSLLEGDNSVVFMTDKSLLAGFIAPVFYSKTYLQAHECAWWSGDGHGNELIARFEEWAWANNADEILISHLVGITPERGQTLIKRRGYVPREVCHVLKRNAQ